MASAGMGDVLSGILGALLAQRFTGESALVLGVHLHGAAADELAASGVGPVGLTASELIDAARRLWNRWLKEHHLLAESTQRIPPRGSGTSPA
jgi:NAD(P)H-hydrate repair Nnr-like enzyme with NAD(P)H-hydrate dehydratase domain